jgi:hypothetical protein
MKPGDLRRFKDNLGGSIAGRLFMVLTYSATDLSSWVSFLIDGRIERGWTGDWVIDSSEVLNETR